MTELRALALGGWLFSPVPPDLARHGVTKLVFAQGGPEYDLLEACIGPARLKAHIRVGRSSVVPWCQFVPDTGAPGPRVSTVAEALAAWAASFEEETEL